MEGVKECKKCGTKGLKWDYAYNKQSGKWRLEPHRKPDGSHCIKEYYNIQTQIDPERRMGSNYHKCENCAKHDKTGHFGWIYKGEDDKHVCPFGGKNANFGF